jgi:Schlafen, AlbA_2
MDDIPLISLLHRSESETLDFKRELPPFSKASDDAKAELLKDIVSMANAWKDSDAYIIIGVEEENGRAKKICGADSTIKDADVQQFVNSNTTHPVSFRVVETQHEEVSLTVIQIDKMQKRPICIKKDMGKLKANVVYIRHGSSTAEASADEIAEMGRRDGNEQKSERINHYWARFRVFLSNLDQKVIYLDNSSRGAVHEITIAENRLPLDEAKDLLKEVGELRLEIEFYSDLKKLTDEIRTVEEFMDLGAEEINKKIGMSFFYKVQELRFKHLSKMKEKYLK